MFSLSFQADQHYRTPIGGGPVITYENLKVVTQVRIRLVNLYAYNSSGSSVVLAVADSADALYADALSITPYPIAAGGFLSIGVHGGDRIEHGLILQAFTDGTLATPAGNVMAYKVDWMAYL